MVVPLLWVLLAALALTLSWVTGAAAFAWAAYLMLVIWLVGAVGARLGVRGLSVTRTLSADRVALNGRVQVEVKLENRSRLPVLWAAAAEALPAGLSLRGVRGRIGPLRPRSEFRFRYTLEGGRRGYYQIGPTVLRTGDLFGIVQRERTGEETARLTVFPRIVAIRHARLPSRRPINEVRVRYRVLEDPTQVIGIRPYQRGDGLRRVHWRATAHTSRLQSKLYQVTAQVDTTVLLNLRRADYAESPADAQEAAELAIVAAASTVHHLLDRRQRTGLLALAHDPAADDSGLVAVSAGRHRDQLTALLSVLGRVELGPAQPLTEALRRAKETFPLGSLLVIVTPRVDTEAMQALLGLRNAGFAVSVILVGRGAELPAEAAGLAALRIGGARVRSEADVRGLNL